MDDKLAIILGKQSLRQPLTSEERAYLAAQGIGAISVPGKITPEERAKKLAEWQTPFYDSSKGESKPVITTPAATSTPLPKSPTPVSFPPETPAVKPVAQVAVSAPAVKPVADKAVTEKVFEAPTGAGPSSGNRMTDKVASTREEAEKKLDAVTDYFNKWKPEGATVQNILDIVAKAAAGYAGKDYQTNAERRREMAMQNAMQAAQMQREYQNITGQMGLGQQYTIQNKYIDLDNQIKVMEQDLINNLGKISASNMADIMLEIQKLRNIQEQYDPNGNFVTGARAIGLAPIEGGIYRETPTEDVIVKSLTTPGGS